MTSYRRNFVEGGSFFFTVNLADRRQRLLVEHIDLLRRAFSDIHRQHPFSIEAIVILPDHLHAIWTLPPGDRDFSVRWRLIKAAFSRGLPPGEKISASRITKGERGIWQRRYWEHTIRDEHDFARHVDYTHFNPVKHAMSAEFAIGRTPHFVAWSTSALFLRIGAAISGTSPASLVSKPWSSIAW